MYTQIGTDALGNPIWGDINGNPITPSKEVVVKSKPAGSKWYNSLIDKGGEILTGAASLFSAFKGNPTGITNIYEAPEEPKKDNTNMIIMAVVVVLILIAIFYFIKKSKA